MSSFTLFVAVMFVIGFKVLVEFHFDPYTVLGRKLGLGQLVSEWLKDRYQMEAEYHTLPDLMLLALLYEPLQMIITPLERRFSKAPREEHEPLLLWGVDHGVDLDPEEFFQWYLSDLHVRSWAAKYLTVHWNNIGDTYVVMLEADHEKNAETTKLLIKAGVWKSPQLCVPSANSYIFTVDPRVPAELVAGTLDYFNCIRAVLRSIRCRSMYVPFAFTSPLSFEEQKKRLAHQNPKEFWLHLIYNQLPPHLQRYPRLMAAPPPRRIEAKPRD
jgi:hypothetical protein